MKQLLLKQLLLNFLFFVAAAAILVQCAKLFPTKENPSAGENTNAAIGKKIDPLSSIPNIATIEPGLYNIVRGPFFHNSAFPYHVLTYFNSYPPFYAHYLNYNINNLAVVNKLKPRQKKDK